VNVRGRHGLHRSSGSDVIAGAGYRQTAQPDGNRGILLQFKTVSSPACGDALQQLVLARSRTVKRAHFTKLPTACCSSSRNRNRRGPRVPAMASPAAYPALALIVHRPKSKHPPASLFRSGA